MAAEPNQSMSNRFSAPVAAALGLGVALLLAGCVYTQTPPPSAVVYKPPAYSYLTPLRLNVATIEIEDSWAPGPDDVGYLSPLRPLDALRRMAQDRLIAAGNSGRAVYRIEDAAIRRVGGNLDGHLAVQLDVYTSEGTRSGYAEARVARNTTAPDALQQTSYTLARQMMNDMNVEFEYQVRHSLRDWLLLPSPPGSAIPAPVQQRPLPPPGT